MHLAQNVLTKLSFSFLRVDERSEDSYVGFGVFLCVFLMNAHMYIYNFWDYFYLFSNGKPNALSKYESTKCAKKAKNF